MAGVAQSQASLYSDVILLGTYLPLAHTTVDTSHSWGCWLCLGLGRSWSVPPFLKALPRLPTALRIKAHLLSSAYRSLSGFFPPLKGAQLILRSLS